MQGPSPCQQHMGSHRCGGQKAFIKFVLCLAPPSKNQPGARGLMHWNSSRTLPPEQGAPRHCCTPERGAPRHPCLPEQGAPQHRSPPEQDLTRALQLPPPSPAPPILLPHSPCPASSVPRRGCHICKVLGSTWLNIATRTRSRQGLCPPLRSPLCRFVKWIEDSIPEDPFLNPELMKNNPWVEKGKCTIL